MFRFAIVVFAIVGVSMLLFGGAQAAAYGTGLLLLAPLLILFKIMLLVLLFGALSSKFWYRSGPWRPSDGWSRSRRPWFDRRNRSDNKDEPSETDRFEEWHRMAHAKEEVDDWTLDV